MKFRCQGNVPTSALILTRVDKAAAAAAKSTAIAAASSSSLNWSNLSSNKLEGTLLAVQFRRGVNVQ